MQHPGHHDLTQGGVWKVSVHEKIRFYISKRSKHKNIRTRVKSCECSENALLTDGLVTNDPKQTTKATLE